MSERHTLRFDWGRALCGERKSASDGDGMRVRRLVGDRAEAAAVDARERVDDRGLELRAAAAHDLLARGANAHGAPVRTVAGHGIEEIGHGEDARAERDLLASQPV